MSFGKVENSKFSKKYIYTFSKNSLKLIKNNQKINKNSQNQKHQQTKIPKNENQISKLIKLIQNNTIYSRKVKIWKVKINRINFRKFKIWKKSKFRIKI